MSQLGITHRDSALPIVLTFTNNLAVGATSATLTANFIYITGDYTGTFNDGEVKTVTLTNGATTCTWTGGLAGAVKNTISVVATHDGAQVSTTALNANSAREYFQIQNQSTTKLYVYFGTGASDSVYHFILKGATGAADGTGGSYSSQSCTWRGIVTVYASDTPSYSLIEM
jgi:hypothetical protein